MVFAVRCPSSRCRKYMLVEPADRGKVIACLVCKRPVQVPAVAGYPDPTLADELLVLDDAPAGLPVAKALPPG